MKIRKIFIVGATLIALIATTKTGKIQSTEHIYDLSSSKVDVKELTTEEVKTEPTTEQKIKIETGGFMIPVTTIEEITTEEEYTTEATIEEYSEPEIIEATTEDYSLPEPIIGSAEEEDTEISEDPAPAYSFDELLWMGVIYWGDYRWTYYSESVLPGEGLNIPGRYTDETGFVCDGNGYICLASSDLGYGTIVSTPFGRIGCVYDSGCPSGTLDVYVR